MAKDRWGGDLGHLYDNVVKCSRCRFYARDPARVVEHEKICTGKFIERPGCIMNGLFCWGCRFDAHTDEELQAHYASGDCVREISHICMDLYALNYDVLDRAVEQAKKDIENG